MSLDDTIQRDDWKDVKIPVFRGLNKLLDADNLKNEELSRAENVRIYNDKIVSSMGYESIRQHTLSGTPMLLHKFTSTAGIVTQLLFTTETVYRDNGIAWVEVTGAILSGSPRDLIVAVSIPWSDQVVFTNGIDPIQVWDSNTGTISIIGGAAANWMCKSLAVYDNSLILLHTIENGQEYPQRERHSDQGDITAWESGTAGFTDLMDSTEPLVTAKNLGSYLILYKTRGIHRMAVSDNPLKRFEIDPMIPDNGILTPYSVTQIERNRHLIWGRDNFFLYAGGYDLDPIGDNISSLMFGPDSIEHPDSLKVHHLIYIEEINEVLAVYQHVDSEDLVDLLIYRFKEESWTQAKLAHPIRSGITPPRQIFLTWDDIEGSWDEQTLAWYQLYVNVEPRTLIFVTETDTFALGAEHEENADEETPRTMLIETKDFSEYPYQARLDWIDIRCSGGPYQVWYSLDEGASWSLYGTIPVLNSPRVVRLHRQVMYESIRFRINTYNGQG